jgi:hypothetical protein
MKKSTFRIIKGIFLMGFLLLFGMFVFILAKQQAAAAHESNIAGDDEPSGRITPSSLKQIGFEYNSSDSSDNSTV